MTNTQTAIRSETVEMASGEFRSVPVVPDELVELLPGDVYRVKGEKRLLRPTGELWDSGPLNGGSDVVLLERRWVEEGTWRSRFAVAKWVAP